MDAIPWRLERAALDALAVKTLLATQFPQLAAQSITRLGEGWDCETWLIDEAWVFRFPKREGVQASLVREALLLPLLAERLHVRLPVPQWSGRPCENFPFTFSGYGLVPGRTWNWSARPSRRLAAFEADFIAFLNGLHGSTAEARRALAQAGGSYPEDDAPIDWTAELARVRDLLTEHLSSETLVEVAPLLVGDLQPPDAFRGEKVLLHFDLSEDHVFMDDAGHVLGVIDWADAGFGDPAVDFIEATIWLGPAFLERAIAGYRHPVDAGFRHRVRYGASVVALLNLAYAVERGDGARAARRQHHLEAVMRPAGELVSWHR